MVATHEPGASRSAETPSPVALAELLDHVPSAGATLATAPDGGTLVGTDSGTPGDEPPRSPEPPKPRRLRLGEPRYQPLLSNPAIERAARAQIYWPLRVCTDDKGALPAPESITLSFTLRPDGTVDPATVSAKPKRAELDAVADCVIRTFSSLAFRGPTAALGSSPNIVILWPSVD